MRDEEKHLSELNEALLVFRHADMSNPEVVNLKQVILLEGIYEELKALRKDLTKGTVMMKKLEGEGK